MLRTVALLAFSLLAAGCETGPVETVGTSHCTGAIFELPIRTAILDGKEKFVVDLELDKSGRVPVILDTGSPINMALIPIEAGNTQSADVSAPFLLRAENLNLRVQFQSVPVPKAVVSALSQASLSSYLIHPQLIDEADYVVMDIRHKRLIGFHDVAWLRRCVGEGRRQVIRADERPKNRIAVDGRIDGAISGRIVLDTGANIVQFFDARIRKSDATQSEDSAFHQLDGVRIVPFVTYHHTVEVGGVTKPIEKAAIPDQSIAPYEKIFVAALGSDVLKDSIMIFPPKSEGYWEFIF